MPAAVAKVEAIRTLAAATSFAIFALTLTSGLTRSTIASKEVLISSRTRTKLITDVRSSHSSIVNFKKYARTNVKPAIPRWILKFGSLCIASLIPETANPKLSKIPRVTLIFKYYSSIQENSELLVWR